MKIKLLLLSSLFVLACGTPKEKVQQEFDTFLETYHEDVLRLYRLPATYLGDTRYNDTLPNYLSKA